MCVSGAYLEPTVVAYLKLRSTAVSDRRGLPTSSPSANLAGRWRSHATRGSVSTDQAVPRRGTHSIASRPSRTVVARHGARRAFVRCALVGGLRHRGDSARAH